MSLITRFVRSVSAGALAFGWTKDQRCIDRQRAQHGFVRSILRPVGCATVSTSFSMGSQLWDGFKSQYRGEVTPKRPAAIDSTGMHGGPFSSRWLRVVQGDHVEEVLEAVSCAEDGAPSAVYVGIPDEYKHSGPLVAALRARGFRFHHFVDGNDRQDDAPAGELIYYRWAGTGPDMVPSYATALEGVGVLVLSPEKDELLLLWEHGMWKMVTGNVDNSESMVAAVRREVFEEVGLELGEEMSLVGGWQHPRSRDNIVNNIFCVFVTTARTRNIQVDGKEIVEAQWFPLASMPSLADTSTSGKGFAMEWNLGMPGRNLISCTVARFLEVHTQGRGLHVLAGLENAVDTASQRTFFN
eukprot:TRINITY_DN88672_c0_g1_i1.p1 TRINITY_DN88672_c0_g1~~TRINITY_DN88672_c0_g1_i1.p1  ORF type:complete len:366 (-),score=44.93 TRINITY_DN88672_c0_g1_i1:112-1176(-)